MGDNCAICFDSSDLIKCNTCTALYCQPCSKKIENNYNNLCSVCNQQFNPLLPGRAIEQPEEHPIEFRMNRLSFVAGTDEECGSFCCRQNPPWIIDEPRYFWLRVLCPCLYWRCCLVNSVEQNCVMCAVTSVSITIMFGMLFIILT